MNDITAKELELLKALQPKIRERINVEKNDSIFVNNKIWNVSFTLGLYAHCLDENGNVGVFDREKFIIIPHPVPMPGVPVERTLWGWIDWNDTWLDWTGEEQMSRRIFRWVYGSDGEDWKEVYSGDNIYLALLCSFAHQEGVKI